jgi:hypothetical protein
MTFALSPSIDIFHLYFNHNFADHALYPTADTLTSLAKQGLPVLTAADYYRVRFLPSIDDLTIEHCPRARVNEPFFKMRNLLFGSKFKADPALKLAFSETFFETAGHAEERRAAHADFVKLLTDWTGGKIRLVTSDKPGTRMLALGDDGQSLYSFTCVFPWALDILRQGPNCLMTDATFRSLHPYSLAILHAVFANETIPIAFSVAPSETGALYDDMYAHILDIMRDVMPNFDEEHNLLTDLPVISDMGTGIRAVIRSRALKWFICHRHLIQSLGAASQAGIWVCRLLKCSSLDEYEKVSRVIKQEMNKLYRSVDGHYINLPENVESVLTMMDPGNNHEFFRLSRWARWLRFGCPTTSNAAESVHGHLNAKVVGHQTLIHRLKTVIQTLQLRYFFRNTWCGTAIRRNRNRLYPSEESRQAPWFSRAKLEFLLRLHSRVGKGNPDEHVQFDDPPQIWLRTDDRTWQSRITDSVPPSSWLHESKKARYLKINIEGAMTLRKHQAYEICQEVSRSLREADWNAHGASITAAVLDLARQYGDESNELSDEEEAKWRIDCRERVASHC